LALLLAVSEQALLELERLDPPDTETAEAVQRLRDRIYEVLNHDPRFARGQATA
jgi:hypothetical protein